MCENGDDECMWSLGFGSNMDVEALVSKKRVNVLGELGHQKNKFYPGADIFHEFNRLLRVF